MRDCDIEYEQYAQKIEPNPPFVFDYTNWRGEKDRRRVIPHGMRFGSTEWHPEPQWLMKAFDLDKQADREFAMRDIQPVT